MTTARRCPFCGAFPETSPDYGLGYETATCQTPGCPVSGRIINLEKWNDRPLEREYEIDLQHAREVLEGYRNNAAQAACNWRVLVAVMDATLSREV